MKNEKQKQSTEERKTEGSEADRNLKKCDICGEYHEKSITHGIEVKGHKKYICQGCADTIHGLV